MSDLQKPDGIAALIARMRAIAADVGKNYCSPYEAEIYEAADALERLTQPVEVEPFTYYLDDEYGDREFSEFNQFSMGRTQGTPLYSAETVARLIAERDAANNDRVRIQAEANAEHEKYCHERNCVAALQEQVKLLRDALTYYACREWDEQQFTYFDMTPYDKAVFKYRLPSRDVAIEALAATEPKDGV